MSILSDWEIKALSLGNELISPFIDKVVSEKDSKRDFFQKLLSLFKSDIYNLINKKNSPEI